MTFGNPVSQDDAIKLVHWALDHGINYFDTADIYEGYNRKPGSRGGAAEDILGKALHDRYDRAVVTTKAGNDIGQGANLKPAYLQQQCESSLVRLRSACIDVYELHKPDPATPLIETLGALSRLIAAGKIRHWGFSNFSGEHIQEMVRLCDENSWPRPIVSQPPYNWLRRDIEEDHLPACLAAGISITPYQPLSGGLLTGKYRRGQSVPPGSRVAESTWLTLSDDAIFDRLEIFESEAKEARLTPGQYAIRWLLHRPSVISVVLGAKRAEQIEDLLTGATDQCSTSS